MHSYSYGSNRSRKAQPHPFQTKSLLKNKNHQSGLASLVTEMSAWVQPKGRRAGDGRTTLTHMSTEFYQSPGEIKKNAQTTMCVNFIPLAVCMTCADKGCWVVQLTIVQGTTTLGSFSSTPSFINLLGLFFCILSFFFLQKSLCFKTTTHYRQHIR